MLIGAAELAREERVPMHELGDDIASVDDPHPNSDRVVDTVNGRDLVPCIVTITTTD